MPSPMFGGTPDPMSMLLGIMGTPHGQKAALDIASTLAMPAKRAAAMTGYLPEGYRWQTPEEESKWMEDAALGFAGSITPKVGQLGLPLTGGGMRPIQAFHGSTERSLKKISSKRAVETEGATFHATNPEVAETFTFPRAWGGPQFYSESGRPIARGRVYETKLTPNRVFEVPEQYAQKFIDDSAFQARVIKEAAANGYDAVRAKNVLEGIGERLKGDVYGVTNDSIIEILRKYGVFGAPPMFGKKPDEQ